MFEIERKFLVDKDKWEKIVCEESFEIKQGYIFNDEKGVLRVRIKRNKGFITIKSANSGLKRLEFEYETPLKEAEELLEKMCDKYISKTRFHYHFDNHLWEIDVFHDKLSPLILAEVELKDENEVFEFPDFIIEEVTSNKSYYNAELINRA